MNRNCYITLTLSRIDQTGYDDAPPGRFARQLPDKSAKIRARPQSYVMMFVWLCCLLSTTLVHAQNGYIYVHKQTLNEESSVAFGFTGSGGTTAISPFSLNDVPAYLGVVDVAGASNGRLWALAAPGNAPTSGAMYYRDPNSTGWSLAGFANNTGYDIDAGPTNTAVMRGTDGQVYFFDGTTLALAGGGNASDVAYDRVNNRIFHIGTGNLVYWKAAAAAGTWTQVPNIGAKRIDAMPSSTGYNLVFVATDNNIYRGTYAGAYTNLGKPANSGAGVDVAASDDGTIYAIFQDASSTNSVYRYTGTAWVQEPETRLAFKIGGGPNEQVWSSVANGTSPRTILPRLHTGHWFDDERVRTTANSNSILLPVVAGTYTITENAVSGWNLQAISVSDSTNNSSYDVAARTATLNVGAGEVVHVTFTNGLDITTTMTKSCANAFTETFGTGTSAVSPNPLTGLTSYHWQGSTGAADGTETVDGYYAVVKNTANAGYGSGNGYQSVADHTGGGYFAFFNANYQREAFYRRRFTNLVPGATYNASYYVMNATAQSGTGIGGTSTLIPPNVQTVVIDPASGTELLSQPSGNITTAYTWQLVSFSFKVPAGQTSIDLLLRNNNIGGGGNDLGIDDIRFALVPPETPPLVATPATCTTGGTITLTAQSNSEIEYSIDGTTYQTSPAFVNVAPGSYTVTTRYTGASGCLSTTAVAVVKPSICGNVFNDANGLSDNTVNGTGVDGTALPLYVSLVQNGTVVATVPVTSTGDFSLTGVSPNTSYSLVLTTNPSGSTTPSLPTGWVNTGEHLGTGAGDDGAPDGVLVVPVSTTSVSNAMFGIEQLPTAGSGTATVSNPGGTSPVTVPPSAFTSTSPSTDTAPGSVTAIRITTFPSNVTSLTIGGNTYTASNFPAGGVVVPTNGTGTPTIPILVDPTNDSSPVVISFKAIDNAGKESTNTGTAILNSTSTAVPDLTPIIYARPSTVYGSTAITVVVDVIELLNVTTSGLVTVRVTKDAKTSLSFDPAATTINSKSVQNSQWAFDGSSNPSYYVLTTSQSVAAGGKLSFGLSGTLTPGATSGTLTVSTVIAGGSGSEVRIDNNVDADKIDYFQQ